MREKLFFLPIKKLLLNLTNSVDREVGYIERKQALKSECKNMREDSLWLWLYIGNNETPLTGRFFLCSSILYSIIHIFLIIFF